MTRDRRNACPHYLHARCSTELLRSHADKRCPISREGVDGMAHVPALSQDVEGWFFCVDAEGDGLLSRQQVLNVLRCQASGL